MHVNIKAALATLGILLVMVALASVLAWGIYVAVTVPGSLGPLVAAFVGVGALVLIAVLMFSDFRRMFKAKEKSNEA